MHLLQKKKCGKSQMREMVEKNLIYIEFLMVVLLQFYDF